MATLEKRVEALEQSVGADDCGHIVLFDDAPVPPGFTGRVHRVVFVESPNADRPVLEPGADHAEP